MGIVEKVIEATIALFIVFIFAAYVFPALGEATGQDVTIAIIALILIAIAVILSLFRR